MNRQPVYRLIVVLFLTSTVVFIEAPFRISAHQIVVSGDREELIAGFRVAAPLSAQQTTVARPTLNPTRMPLTVLPLATIRVELTATAQQATARALIPTARSRPSPTPVVASAAPTPKQVPIVGQASSILGNLVLLALALCCVVMGGAIVFFSRIDRG
jgi:hypothetical protein